MNENLTENGVAMAMEPGETHSEGNVEDFKNALEDMGYTVNDVEFKLTDPAQLYDDSTINSCNGNNLGNPYHVFKVTDVEGQANKNPKEGLVFYLREDEAIVLVGLTPPACKYFSYRSFLFSRNGKKVYASLGDTVNFMNINTGALPDRTNPFQQNFIMVTTADQGINERVQEAAISVGYDPKIMNTDIIPSDIVNMGLDADCDTFSFLNRTAMFDNPIDKDNYNSNPGVVAFRVTPAASATPTVVNPFPTPTMRLRGTGKTEMDLMPAIEELRIAILAQYDSFSPDELITEVWLREGYEYIQTVQDAIGESRDTSYLRTDKDKPFILPDSSDDFLIVYGINHTAIGKSTYSNFITYGEDILNGVASVNNEQFAGSAEKLLPYNPLAKYLYVWKVARQSYDNEDNCLIVPTDDPALGIPLDKPMFVGFRAYVEPETQIGPAWQELIFDRVIKFSKKA